MATLLQKEQLTRNQDLQARVRTVVIDEAIKALEDDARTDEHTYYVGVMSSQSGGEWLQTLMWEVVRNPSIQTKLIDEPHNHSASSVDIDIVYILTNADTGVLKKYSIITT